MNRAMHAGDRSSNFLYPTVGVAGRFGIFRMDFRTQLPVLIIDAVAYAIGFIGGSHSKEFPLSGALNGTDRLGPAEFMEGDVYLAPWRSGAHRLDLGVRLSLRLMDYFHNREQLSAGWLSTLPAASFTTVQGPSELSGTVLGGPQWSSHGRPGGAIGAELGVRTRIVGAFGAYARLSLLRQWLDARYSVPSYQEPTGHKGSADWYWMSTMTGGVSLMF